MAETARRRVEVGLVLQGGGALGAYEWGAVSALLELMEEAQAAGREVVLRAVTGVSIGAINAACVVGSASFRDAGVRLRALWEDLRLDTPPFIPAILARDLAFFGLPGFYTPRADVWNVLTWTSLYDTTPLIGTLRDHVDFRRLNDSATAFVVTAVDVESGTLTRFRNREGAHPEPKETHAGAPVADRRVEIGPEHILASGSLAPQFPWTAIDGRDYWDGGLVDNTPLGDAIDAFSGEPETVRLLVVMNLYPLRGAEPATMGQVLDRVHELSFGNRLRQDQEGARRINAMIETIDRLAALVEAGQPEMPDELRLQVERYRRYKLVDVLDIDFQNRDGAGEDPVDDENGLRDFSPQTVEDRRRYGYALARRRLGPAFADLDGLMSGRGPRSSLLRAGR